MPALRAEIEQKATMRVCWRHANRIGVNSTSCQIGVIRAPCHRFGHGTCGKSRSLWRSPIDMPAALIAAWYCTQVTFCS